MLEVFVLFCFFGLFLLLLLFLFCFVFRDRVSLCSFGAYPGTCSGEQAGLEHREICLPLEDDDSIKTVNGKIHKWSL